MKATFHINRDKSKVTVFNIDQCRLERPFVKCGPIDTVVHTATKYDRNGESASQLLDANISFPFKLLETVISFRIKTFINTDSLNHKNNVGYKYLAGHSLTKNNFSNGEANLV